MKKSLKSLSKFEYRFQRFLGSRKSNSLYEDLLNNILNIYIFEYLSGVGASMEIPHQKKRKGSLLKFSKIRFFRPYLTYNKCFVSLSTLLKLSQRTQRFRYWGLKWN